MPYQNYDVYLEADGVSRGFLIPNSKDTGNKQYTVSLAPTFAPQQRLNTANLYEGQPPEVTVTSASEQWTTGAGVFDASASFASAGIRLYAYDYSRGVDLSDEHRVYLSPKRNLSDVHNADTFNGHAIRFIATSFGTFCITENEIYRWSVTDEHWDSVNTLGSYLPGALEHDGYLYVPRSGTNAYIYSNDGVNWTASTRSSNDKYATAFCNRGDNGETSATYNVIVRLRGNAVSASTDGLNSGSAWSTEDQIGPTNETSKAITPDTNNVIIWKREGVYTFDFQNVDNFYTSSYNDVGNADHVFQWVDGLFYANYGTSVFQFDFTNSSIVRVYPTQYMDSPELRGQVVGITGDDQFLYVAIKNSDGRTYMMKGKPGGAFHSYAVFNIYEHEVLAPGTGRNDSAIGNIAWGNPSNITLPDSQYASVSDGISQWLVADNFGFDVPSDALITGALATVYRKKLLDDVAVNDTQVGSLTTSTSGTWSHTCSGTERYLVVSVLYSEGPEAVSTTAVTYNGTAMELLRRVQLPSYTYWDSGSSTYVTVDSDVYTELWGLVDPDSGAGNVSVTFSGEASNWGLFPISFPHTWGVPPSMMSVSFENVDQTTPISSFVTDSNASSTSPSATVGVVSDARSYTFAVASAFSAGITSSPDTVLVDTGYSSLSVGEVSTGANVQFDALVDSAGSLDLVGFSLTPITGTVEDYSVKLFKNGVAAGNELKYTGDWAEVTASREYGSNSSLPGVGLTPSDVMNSGFGIGISVEATGSAEAEVDYVEMRLTYYVPGSIRSTQAISVVAPQQFKTNNACLLSGYGNDVVYYILPRANRTPLQDENYLFQTDEEAFVVGAWDDYGGSAYTKFLNRGTIIGQNITSGKAVTLSYETDTGLTGDVVTAKQSGFTAGNIDEKIQFNRIRYTVTLNTTSSTTSPWIEGWTLQSTLNQPRYRVWEFVTDLSNEQALLEGNSDYFQDSVALEEFLFELTMKRPVFTDMMGRRYNVRIDSLQSLGYAYHVQGNEERFAVQYQVRLLEIGPLSSQVSSLAYGSNAWGRERDWS